MQGFLSLRQARHLTGAGDADGIGHARIKARTVTRGKGYYRVLRDLVKVLALQECRAYGQATYLGYLFGAAAK